MSFVKNVCVFEKYEHLFLNHDNTKKQTFQTTRQYAYLQQRIICKLGKIIKFRRKNSRAHINDKFFFAQKTNKLKKSTTIKKPGFCGIR